jgi:hypothetical protein
MVSGLQSLTFLMILKRASPETGPSDLNTSDPSATMYWLAEGFFHVGMFYF